MRDRHTQLILSPSLEHFLRGDHSALLPSSLRFPVYHSFRLVPLNSSLAMKLPIAVVFVLTVYVLDSAAAGWEHISEMNLEDFAVKECNYTISNADDLTKYISSPSRKLCCQFSHVIQCSKNFLLKVCVHGSIVDGFTFQCLQFLRNVVGNVTPQNGTEYFRPCVPMSSIPLACLCVPSILSTMAICSGWASVRSRSSCMLWPLCLLLSRSFSSCDVL